MAAVASGSPWHALGTQIQAAVAAELRRGCSEQRLLYACNETAAARCQQLSGRASAATRQLQDLAEQHARELVPALSVLGELEAQVCGGGGGGHGAHASSRRASDSASQAQRLEHLIAEMESASVQLEKKACGPPSSVSAR